MAMRHVHTQQRRRWRWNDITLTLLPFVPVAVLFATLDIIGPLGSPTQKTVEIALYAFITVVIAFMEMLPPYRKLVRAHIMFSVFFLGYYITSIEAVSHSATWTLLGVPGVFVLLACLLSQPGFQALPRRLALCTMAFLFLATIYLADIFYVWWMPLVISLMVGGIVWLFLRVFTVGPRYLNAIIGKVTLLATLSIVAIALFLGITAAGHAPAGASATLVVCFIATFYVRRITLRRSMLLWCVLTLIILFGTMLFTPHNNESWLVCLFAGACIAGAALASWFLPVVPLPRPYDPHTYHPHRLNPYAPEIEEYDEEDYFGDDMAASNDEETGEDEASMET